MTIMLALFAALMAVSGTRTDPISAAAGAVVAFPSASVPADSIEWAPASPLVPDCSDDVERPVCRVRRSWSRAEVKARLDAGQAVWREGNEITFAHSAAGPAVLLGGGIQTEMSTFAGTNLRLVTLRIPRLDEAMITWFFVPLAQDQQHGLRFVPAIWRGPAAAPPPDSVAELAGIAVHDTLHSRFLPAPRPVLVYIPPPRGSDPIGGVVYAGDGGALYSFAKYLEPLMLEGRLPRLLLIAAESSRDRGDGSGMDGRSAEYLLGAEPDSARFLAHERFFMEELIPFARMRYGAPSDPRMTAIAGFSNSAALAIDLGLRHPDVFGAVVAFSPGGGRRVQVDGDPPAERLPRFFLLGGTLEGGFHARPLAWSKLLRERGAAVVMMEPVAGHDSFMWAEYLPQALHWVFSGSDQH